LASKTIIVITQLYIIPVQIGGFEVKYFSSSYFGQLEIVTPPVFHLGTSLKGNERKTTFVRTIYTLFLQRFS